MSTAASSARPARRGYLILTAIAVAGVVIFNLEAIGDLLRRHVDLVALVKHAPGVRVGTEVRLEGVKVGRVTNVSLVNDRDTAVVALDLRVDRRARALITVSSDVRAARRRFIAEPVVRVSAGQPGDPIIQPGDTIRGRPRPDPTRLIDQAAALTPAIDSIRHSTREIQTRIDQRRPHLDRLLERVMTSAVAARALTAQLETGSLRRMADPQTGLASRLHALRLHTVELRAAVDDLRVRTSDQGALAEDVRRLDGTVARLEATVGEIEVRVRETDGFVGRIQVDTALHLAVRGVRLQVDSLLAEAHSIARRMLLP